MTYIELNMVRADVVAHPVEWTWCSYGELMGHRKRYRLIDREHVRGVLGQDTDSESFRENDRARVEVRRGDEDLTRNPEWRESLALGRKEYVDEIAVYI